VIILALDTSTHGCSVAVLEFNPAGIISNREVFEITPRKHTERIFPMLDQILNDCRLQRESIDIIAFANGPGAFTGIRIAAGIAKAMAFALDKPLISISTLATLGQGYVHEGNAPATVIVANDARMNEIYAAAYHFEENGVMTTIFSDCLCSAQELVDKVISERLASWYGMGSAWEEFKHPLQDLIADKACRGINAETLPHARDVAILAYHKYKNGQLETAVSALPAYLRNKVTG